MGVYFGHGAHDMYKSRQQAHVKQANLKLTDAVIEHIKRYLKQEFSPEQISAVLRLKHHILISQVTIYTLIHKDRLHNGTLHTYLRHQGKRRAKYGVGRKNRIANRISIEQRPAIVDQRIRIGDFEADTIIGKGRQGAIVTIVERRSMYLKLSIPIRKKELGGQVIMIARQQGSLKIHPLVFKLLS